MDSASDRRRFLVGASALVSAALVLPSSAQSGQAEAEDDVSTNEDLMREHGVLNRILLIYDEALRRISAKQTVDPAIVGKAAGLIQKFIEDYHEKLEENHLFPRFEKAGKLADLTKVLRAQHIAGRTLTGRILAAANSNHLQ